MTDISGALLPALKGMDGEAPSALLDTVNFYAKRAGLAPLDEAKLISALTVDDANDRARIRFQLLISRWDSATDEQWADGNGANSAQRRALVYDKLELSDHARAEIDAAFPRDPGAVIIVGGGGRWHPWYDAERRAARDFYWKAYSGLLEADPGWNGTAISRLDSATSAVISRLADPTWTDPYQSKGLVVGYVQSGKTANFTGVVAKAIDAGYRLIIILTGTVEILRRQTQRRLDMELVGVENILGGIDPHDLAKVATTDYHADQDWLDGQFLVHGVPVHAVDDIPTIRRLSTFSGDYRRLRQGLATLDFRAGHELVDKNKPLFDSVNLFRSDVRIAVVKKNSTVLQRLVDDLGEIHADLVEIPTLIIDDEADQASVNTKRQKNPSAEEKERTAINQRLSELLKLLTRAQYVGYTATPFANVFISPDDSEDLFPKDFILSLDRPEAYMGARDFHDLDADFTGVEKTMGNSNEKAFVRGLYADDNEDQRRREIQRAIDAFVLTGALKLSRRGPNGPKFRHHTMLVHESVKQAEHATLADQLRELWRRSGYNAPAGLARLRKLFDEDFAPVAEALQQRASSEALAVGRPEPEPCPLPVGFDQLVSGNWIGKALDLIDTGTSPVIVVNGVSEKDYEQDALDFQGGDVWKILVGGTKLSRGFTVEGLTISYYTRRTLQADTLMQMGRWFGFRDGYRDLVRLYIGRNVPAPRGQHVDLYEAFEAVVRDEEDFRGELARYAAINIETGFPQIRPEDVPPMVFQQLPWLKPTAANKMYNAELVRKGEGGKLVDFPLQADRNNGVYNVRHFALVQPLLDAITDSGEFWYTDRISNKEAWFIARYGIVDTTVLWNAVAEFAWAAEWSFAPALDMFDAAVRAGTLTDVAVLLPDLTGTVQRPIGDRPGDLPLLRRRRRPDRSGFSGSSKRQRQAIETIAGNREPVVGMRDESGGPLAVSLYTPTRGAMLLTFAMDNGDNDADPKKLPPGPIAAADVATLFSWALPYGAAPGGRIGFRTRKKDAGAIIDAST